MRRGFYLAAFFALCAASALAAEPKKDAEKDPKKPEPEKLISLGQVAGVLTSTGGSESGYTIRVTLHVVEPNPQAQLDLLKKNQQLVQKQAQIMRERNPWQRQQQMVQFMREAQQAPGNLFTVKEVQQDVKAGAADDMKVRLAQPPEAFDDKGNLRKYTDKELKELKGTDSSLPGYTGALDDLKNNQLVLVTLARKPLKAKEEKAKDDKAKDDKAKDDKAKDNKAKDADKLWDKDNPILIRMIVVLGDKK
jgi:hypothetical protein